MCRREGCLPITLPPRCNSTPGAHRDELLAILRQEGLEPQGDLILNQYHPPFTWGWQRRNEVMYSVVDAPLKET